MEMKNQTESLKIIYRVEDITDERQKTREIPLR
ncbi:MAG: hypothetical protein ACI88H_000704 [Cocleimonas sp.]|jgi:hypothetical protein